MTSKEKGQKQQHKTRKTSRQFSIVVMRAKGLCETHFATVTYKESKSVLYLVRILWDADAWDEV